MVSRIYFLALLFCSSSALLYQSALPLAFAGTPEVSPVPGTPVPGTPGTNPQAESASEREACGCPPEDDLEAAYDKASVVFVGRVEEKQNNPLKKGVVEVKFFVQRKLKGFEEVRNSSVLVYTPDKSDSPKPGECGFNFSLNGEYLVYAEGTLANFRTTLCSRTNLLEDASMDVQRIIRLYPQE